MPITLGEYRLVSMFFHQYHGNAILRDRGKFPSYLTFERYRRSPYRAVNYFLIVRPVNDLFRRENYYEKRICPKNDRNVVAKFTTLRKKNETRRSIVSDGECDISKPTLSKHVL